METSTSTPSDEARSIDREAYPYGFPMVENYKTLYKQAIDTSQPDCKAPINQIGRAAGVVTPESNSMPNSISAPEISMPEFCSTLPPFA